jgi:hypothetical protein
LTLPENDRVVPTVARSFGAASAGGIWSFASPTEATPHHLPFESARGSGAGLWASQVLDAAFADLTTDLLEIRL